MRIIVAFIAFCFLQTAAYRIAAQDIRFKIVETPKDQNWGLIVDMTQDSTGFVWLATWNGVYRYDGLQYTSYYHNVLNSNSLANNRTECVFADKDRFIYVGTYGGGLDQLNPLTGIFKHFTSNKNDPNSLSSDTITVITKDRNGKLWVGTMNGLNEFDPQTGKCKRFLHNDNDPASISENEIRVVYQDREGVVWIGTKGPFVENDNSSIGGLNRYDPKTGKFTRYLHDPNDPLSLVDNRITAIFEDSRGNLLIGTAGDGLHIMNRQTDNFQRLPYDPKHPENMSRPEVLDLYRNSHTDHITFITEDKLGNIWIGTMENGINVYDPVKKMTTHFGSKENNINKLADNEFWQAFKSKEGIMWITTYSAGGENFNLYQINPFEYKFSRTEIGYNIMSFLDSDDGSLWIGTDSCLMKRNVNGSLELYPIKIDGRLTGSKNYVSSIVRDDKGNLWISPQGGIYRFDPTSKTFTGYFRKDHDPSSLGCDTVFLLEDAGNNKFWIATFNGLDLLDIQSGKFTHYRHNPEDSNSLAHNYITAFLNQKNGNLLVGGESVVDKMDTGTGKFTHYKINGLVLSIVEDDRGTIWAGTNQGLYKFDEVSHTFINYLDYTQIINSGTVVSKLAMDNKKNLFIATFTGLIRLNTQTNEISVHAQKNGFANNQLILRNLLVRKNGNVLVTDNLDYLSFNPDSAIRDLPKTTVLITGFLLSDKMITPGPGSVLSKPVFETKEIELNYNQNLFSFTYTTIDYTEKNANIPVLYMLENYDLKWRKANSEYSANYVNVPPGNYVFKVKATNSTGVWVEKEIKIIINPPWWKTTWAYIFYGIFFIILGFIANRIIRGRIIEKEKAKHREKELAHAKEIEKAYNDLKLTQAQLIQSEKMASLGEMTAGIAHEIQNPLNFVNNFSDVNTELIAEMKQELDKGNIEEVKAIANDIEENEQKINHHGKRADSIVKGMLLHSRRSSGIKEPTDINALTDEYLRLSFHGLRAKDKSFNATMHTDFDESVGKINVIPQDIGRVLLNLYNNAFYAASTPSKGAISEPDKRNNPTLWVSTKKVGNKVLISVRDNGPGIPSNIVEKIFQPFFTTKPTGSGTGLGLSLSYDIIKAHGGEIKVETLPAGRQGKEGEGSEFILQLPADS